VLTRVNTLNPVLTPVYPTDRFSAAVEIFNFFQVDPISVKFEFICCQNCIY